MINRRLSDPLSNLCVLGVLSANPFPAGESTRAKLAKLAKVKGTKHGEDYEELVGFVLEGGLLG